MRDSDKRVALVASSSWSHAFLNDKDWHLRPDTAADRGSTTRWSPATTTRWTAHDRRATIVDAGQHEMLNWFCLLGAVDELGLDAGHQRLRRDRGVQLQQVLRDLPLIAGRAEAWRRSLPKAHSPGLEASSGEVACCTSQRQDTDHGAGSVMVRGMSRSRARSRATYSAQRAAICRTVVRNASSTRLPEGWSEGAGDCHAPTASPFTTTGACRPCRDRVAPRPCSRATPSFTTMRRCSTNSAESVIECGVSCGSRSGGRPRGRRGSPRPAAPCRSRCSWRGAERPPGEVDVCVQRLQLSMKTMSKSRRTAHVTVWPRPPLECDEIRDAQSRMLAAGVVAPAAAARARACSPSGGAPARRGRRAERAGGARSTSAAPTRGRAGSAS